MMLWRPANRALRSLVHATPSMGALFLLACILVAAVGLGGCDRDKPAQPPRQEKQSAPTLRIYALAGAAGAVEPCGCVKDMLGGVDHAAAYIKGQKKVAPEALVLGAGPMFFEDPAVKKGQETQALFKAEAMADSLKVLGLRAWAPGANDWALGTARFDALRQAVGADALAANLKKGAGSVVGTKVVSAGGLRVGIVGVTVPNYASGKVKFAVGKAAPALRAGVAKLKKEGAEILVALIAAQRGEALRLVEGSPELHLAIVGKGYDQGDANDPIYAPELIGGTLVAQAPNHLQGVSVLDLYVRDGDHTFVDGSGISFLQRSKSLEGRISDLQERLAGWKKPGSGVSATDIGDRERELASLKKELAALPRGKPPQKGSYFLYHLTEVREGQGEDGQVASRLLAYYQRVNEFNKEAFADKVPLPVEEGESFYLGVEICSSCHLEERAVWDKMQHSGAYETLSSQHKEFNLDCVGCHVTGYEKRGGSTVTHVENLKNVQCEVCHGPGSRHLIEPNNKDLISIPGRDFCAMTCHHAPHVGEDWSVDAAWPQIVTKGHRIEKQSSTPVEP